MKKNIFNLSLVSLLFFACTPEEEVIKDIENPAPNPEVPHVIEKTSLEKNNLKGQVKEIVSSTFEVYGNDEWEVVESKYTFTPSGNMNFKKYIDDREWQSEHYELRFEYNSYNQVIHFEQKEYGSPYLTIDYTYNYGHGSLEKVVKTNHENASYSETIQYQNDANGAVQLGKIYNGNNQLKYNLFFETDSKKRKTNVRLVKPGKEVYDLMNVFEYDDATHTKTTKIYHYYDNCRLILKKQFNMNDQEVYVSQKTGDYLDASAPQYDTVKEYIYNQNNDVIEEVITKNVLNNYGGTNEAVQIFTYAYEYDSQNNWIKKEVFKNGEAIEVVNRTITYY